MEENNKKDYVETLHLPKTDFPMKGNLANKEPEILENVFEEGKLYQKLLKKNEKNKDKKTYVLHDGPPYANGEIHIGHALNKVLKDAIVKYKAMQGYYSPYIPGYDTHRSTNREKSNRKVETKKRRNSCKCI